MKEDPNQKPIALKPELKELLRNLTEEYTLRVSNGTFEVNKSYWKVTDGEIRISKDGISIVNAKVHDCITSW